MDQIKRLSANVIENPYNRNISAFKANRNGFKKYVMRSAGWIFSVF